MKTTHISDRVSITLRDWWRGYSDADIASAIEKAERMVRAGEWVGVTTGEMKAIQHGALRKTAPIMTKWLVRNGKL